METTAPATFAKLLRRYRQEGGLTQEALAERARLSREAVSALERGERQYPRPDTVDLLAALQRADRLAAQASALGQCLLGKAALQAIVPEQLGKCSWLRALHGAAPVDGHVRATLRPRTGPSYHVR